MIKIFLVEDEVIIRNGIKNSIDWEKEGYEFVGEASDGELAYPLIKKVKPDILITDIKMPFMDGLELSEIIKKENPSIKIIILSGYDEFAYAKKAIGIGVTNYLLKPIAADKLMSAINDVAAIIRRERKEQELMHQYSQEMQENTEHEKFQFFNMLVSGSLSMTEIIEKGSALGMDLSAAFYTIMLFKFLNPQEDGYSEEMQKTFAEMGRRIQEREGVITFGRGIDGWAFLFSADSREELERAVEEFRCSIKTEMSALLNVEYYGALAEPVTRLRELKRCFREADSVFASRFFNQPNQIVRKSDVERMHSEDQVELKGFGNMEQNRTLIDKFLRGGARKDVEGFVKAYFEVIPEDNLRSMMMRQYIMMDIYVRVNSFGGTLDIEKEELKKQCGDIKAVKDNVMNLDNAKAYVADLLDRMIVLRDTVSQKKYSGMIDDAKEYILNNYMKEDISLNSAAGSVNLSPSYFSSIFSQEMGKTFVEYLTEVRMDKAKELLMCSSMKSAEIGYEIGYKDAHYFSYIFKKTQKCTPKEYRTRGKAAE
ncbi:MAG: response regulator [Hespellia sp.]|nr:response regulator [Hespellia sp.]